MAKLCSRDDNKNSIQELLKLGGWHNLVSVAFRSRLQPAQWDQKLCETAHDWWLCASEVIAEPHPVELSRTVWFDFKGPFDGQGQSFLSAARNELENCRSQGEALWVLLGGAKDASSFDLFTRLLELSQKGLFDDVLLRLRRHAIPTAALDATKRDIGVMRYEELSDGEQMFMGRMALLHLLSGRQDSLLLLDEPETHFNDLWKRDLVSVVDDALAHTSVDVLIATHAALMLTDALKDELIVLERTTAEGDSGPSESGVRTLDAQIYTFGATGDHPLRDIFGASDTVGRRASRLLEVLLATAQFGFEVEQSWHKNEALGADLISRILDLAQQTESGLTRSHVIDCLESFERFALYFDLVKPLTVKALLEAFIRQTGPGYFQVELKRAWRCALEGAFMLHERRLPNDLMQNLGKIYSVKLRLIDWLLRTPPQDLDDNTLLVTQFGQPIGKWFWTRIGTANNRTRFGKAVMALAAQARANPAQAVLVAEAIDHDAQFHTRWDLVGSELRFPRLFPGWLDGIKDVAIPFYTWLAGSGFDPKPFALTGSRLDRAAVMAAFRSQSAVVCGYCDGPLGEKGSRHEANDCDHFFPKSQWPHFAIHPANLFSACKGCNSTWKLARVPMGGRCFRFEWHLSPDAEAGRTIGCSDCSYISNQFASGKDQYYRSDYPRRAETLVATLDLDSRWTNSANGVLDRGISVLVAKSVRDKSYGWQVDADSVRLLIEDDIAWKREQLGKEERCMRLIAVLECMRSDLLHEVVADLA